MGLGSYKEWVLFTYSTARLKYSDKVRFYYALKGRDGISGIIKEGRINQLARTVLVVPFSFAGKFQLFLEHWKCNYRRRDLLLEK